MGSGFGSSAGLRPQSGDRRASWVLAMPSHDKRLPRRRLADRASLPAGGQSPPFLRVRANHSDSIRIRCGLSSQRQARFVTSCRRTSNNMCVSRCGAGAGPEQDPARSHRWAALEGWFRRSLVQKPAPAHVHLPCERRRDRHRHRPVLCRHRSNAIMPSPTRMEAVDLFKAQFGIASCTICPWRRYGAAEGADAPARSPGIERAYTALRLAIAPRIPALGFRVRRKVVRSTLQRPYLGL